MKIMSNFLLDTLSASSVLVVRFLIACIGDFLFQNPNCCSGISGSTYCISLFVLIFIRILRILLPRAVPL